MTVIVRFEVTGRTTQELKEAARDTLADLNPHAEWVTEFDVSPILAMNGEIHSWSASVTAGEV